MSRNSVLLSEAARVRCSNIVAFEPENIFYMTGFWGEVIALLNSDGLKLVSPKLEVARARKGSRNCEIIESERGSDMLKSLLSNLGQGNVCTDCNDYSTLQKIRQKIGKRLVHNIAPFHNARKIKDDNEIEIIAKASRILDGLFAVCEEKIKAGMSEKQLQALLLYEAMEKGAYPPSYRFTVSPLIVASGPNSSLPHAEPTDRKIRGRDLVTVDLTLRYKGYIADATRTFAVGTIDAEKKKVYGIVKEAQQHGLEAIKPGMQCGAVDNACRSFINKKGYGKYFIHSTGHGIGVEVHEPPWVRAMNEEVLQKKMAVTVEPGIYIPDKFGVRIEDSVIVDRKARVLNKYTKDLISVG
jgi:Xaa-Pro aminopeptidase/Xaa-Pro dipeptidase